MRKVQQTRRTFMATAAATTGLAALPAGPVRAEAKYVRHNVTSPEGRRALASYAKGVAAMLKLPPDHPQNWFRNSFIHLMDCPHGNWWFYVWHRGYIGYLEQTIRSLSGDADFALPYWDWTEIPRIPEEMFVGALNPASVSFQPVTGNLAKFQAQIEPAMQAYWKTLSDAQRQQLDIRGYKAFGDMWNDVTGYSPANQAGISGNMAYAITCGARYLSPDNPHLDPKTSYDCSLPVVLSGLAPKDFYNVDNYKSFTSSKTPSHNTQPSGATKFSVLEGLPHNNVHNCIGGVGPVDPGPYGSMTNFLSPVDPIFFLHHANLDRLWDVWTRKQQKQGLPYLPTGSDLETLSNEPFLFYANGEGGHVGPAKAGDYLSMEVFNYRYAPGSGEQVVKAPPKRLKAKPPGPPILGRVNGPAGVAAAPRPLIEAHIAGALEQPLMVEVTFPRPAGLSTVRAFDVLINAPPGVTQVEADSPYYAGTIAFFGPMMSHGGHGGHGEASMDATFAVPLPRTQAAYPLLGAAETVPVNVRVVPAHGRGAPPPLKTLRIGAL